MTIIGHPACGTAENTLTLVDGRVILNPMNPPRVPVNPLNRYAKTTIFCVNIAAGMMISRFAKYSN